ncbi:MAG: hypothetical protein ABF969_15030 [Sporolactobacillus sp.]
MNEQKEKIKYTALLFIALSLFLVGIAAQSLIACILSIGLAYYVKKNGYSILFEKYDRKNKERYEKANEIRLSMAAKSSKNN